MTVAERWARSIVALAVALAAVPVQAQETVRGAVTDSQGTPISGAMVVILSDTSPVARQLTDSNGDYTAVLPSPGRYSLRVDRIGYQSTRADPFEVATGASVRVDVQVGVEPVVLRGLDVTGEERCAVDPRQGAATAVVWEEARKALEAARWTQDREMYRFLWSRHTRSLDASGRVRGEDRDRRRTFAPRPFRALAPDTLVEHGFVREEDGNVFFSAPDAEVLLSDAFLDSHCFGLREATAQGEDWLGLTFEPVPWRNIPEVRGVLWLDTEGARLRSIEYQYVNHRTLAVHGDDAHGALAFWRLPNGTWIVDAWSITMPRLTEVRDHDGRSVRYDVLGYVDEGGVVTAVQRQDGSTVLRLGQASLEGVVTDSLGQPVTGARIQVEGTPHETRSGESGAFHIDDLGQGNWSLRANHAALSAWGYPGTVVETTLENRSAASVEVQLPSLASWARTLCDSSAGPETAHVLGRLVNDANGPAAGDLLTGASVRLTWNERRGVRAISVQGVGTAARGDGTFHVCAVPAGRALSLSAETSDGTGRTEVVIPPEVEAVTVELPLRAVDGMAERGAVTTTASSGLRVSSWVDSTGFGLRSNRALFQAGPEELAMARPDSLTELFVQIARVEVREPGIRQTEFWLHPTSSWTPGEETSQSCILDTYLNGSRILQRVFGNQGTAWHRQIEPRSVSAIEVYEGAVAPVGATDSCGAILLWVERLRDADDPVFQGRIEGRIHSDEPLPAGGVPVRLVPGGREARTDADGRFRFDAVPPASYTLEVEVPGWGAWSMEVEVRAGATTTASLSARDP